MKKTILYLLTVILLCGVTVSCHNYDNEDDDLTKTIFVFCPYADNMTTQSYLARDLTEMSNAIKANGNMNGYRVIVYYGTGSFTAKLYEIKLQDGEIVNDVLKTYSAVTQNDQQQLTELFSLVKSLAPASSYTFVIGGHGCGWLPKDVNWGDIPNVAYSNTAKGPLKSFGASTYEHDRIEPATLSAAMTAASFHPDLTIFDCCHMANIETFYDLRNNTDYIIASAGEQPGDGMPYTDIWNYLPGKMTKDMINNILQTTLTYYDKNNSGYYAKGSNESLNPLSLGAIDCSEIDNIAAAMANLNKKYGECANDLTNTIQRFDKKTVGVFFNLLDYAKYQAGGNTSDTYYTAVENAVRAAVVGTACNGWYLTILDKYNPNCWPVNTFCGITTSDPSTNTYITDKKQLTNWWTATH